MVEEQTRKAINEMKFKQIFSMLSISLSYIFSVMVRLCTRMLGFYVINMLCEKCEFNVIDF